jgi:hypothetical protein
MLSNKAQLDYKNSPQSTRSFTEQNIDNQSVILCATLWFKYAHLLNPLGWTSFVRACGAHFFNHIEHIRVLEPKSYLIF